MVVDASVWVSAVIPAERFHLSSVSWLAHQTLPSLGVTVPSIALAEIAGALARRPETFRLARSTLAEILELPSLRIVAVGAALAYEAAHLAIDLHLRGADAVYVALAARLHVPLVTWDHEILERAAAVIAVRTPPNP